MIIEEDGKKVSIKNFLGSREVKEFEMISDCKATMGNDKDFLSIEGINLENVAQSAANIVNDCLKRKKHDKRIFLDGIYNSKKTTIIENKE